MTKDLPEGIPRGDQEIWFHFPPAYTRFGREEFCLVTGLHFGRHDDLGPYSRHVTTPSWLFRAFPDLAKVKATLHVDDLSILLHNDSFTRMGDLDVVRVCLLLLLYAGFLGKQGRQPICKDLVSLVDGLDAWNMFPWGSYIWKSTWQKLSSALEDRPSLREHGSKYTLLDFIWAFKIWIFEAFPIMHTYAIKNSNNIPRAITWKRIRQLAWGDILPYMTIDDEANYPLQTLTPTEAEAATDWWQASRRFFDGTDDEDPPHFHRADSFPRHRDPSPHPADSPPGHRDPSPHPADSPPGHRDPSPIPSHHRANSPPSPHVRRPEKMPRIHLSLRSPYPWDELGALRDEVRALRDDNGALRDEVGALREIVSSLQNEVRILRKERSDDMLHDDHCNSEPASHLPSDIWIPFVLHDGVHASDER